jgi:hypothetical protein
MPATRHITSTFYATPSFKRHQIILCALTGCLGVRVWKVHLELSRLLVRMGLLPRAEAILFEATSLGA